MSNSTWGDVAAAVSKFAPILGNAIPGVGTLIGAGVGLAASVAAKALGVDPTPDSIMTALAGDPDAIVKLQTAQMDHEKDLVSIAAQREATQLAYQQSVYASEAADRDSARKLAAAQPRDWIRPLITMTLLLGALAIAYYVLSGGAAAMLKDATVSLTIGTVIGYWFNELKQTLAFWFGMTKDGTMQTQAITQFATAPGTVTAAPPGVSSAPAISPKP